ncbi:hypothetical protein P154DRAFT_324217 [Amniculicola lignicola CBS 123094]|uniref:Uncharacterized protein n=1 Tax=Amniculicola lignicola CBS 123094 TaxID=1392246 RepID=A0A6A5WEZ3_9PLEO|nr:hypothetical protein P154DRAFT_324217 [Amniculicola lignicola CBS 123094]
MPFIKAHLLFKLSSGVLFAGERINPRLLLCADADLHRDLGRWQVVWVSTLWSLTGFGGRGLSASRLWLKCRLVPSVGRR